MAEGSTHAGWPRLDAALAAGVAVAVAAFIGLGELGADPGPQSPSSSPEALMPSPDEISEACQEEPPPEPVTTEVLVYFMCEPPPAEPRALAREGRGTSEPAAQLRVALEALLVGPTAAERDRGYTSVFPPNSEELLASVEWQTDGLAIIDFDEAVTGGLALNSSHNRFVFFRSVEETVFQFDAVTGIEYRLQSSCADFASYFETMCDHTVRAPAPTVINGCPVIEPAKLPSGATTTTTRDNIQAAPGQHVSWGSGSDTVTLRVEPYDAEFEPPAEHVVIRGQPGFASLAGDPPQSVDPDEPRVQVGWVEGGCLYLVWIGPGVSLEEAIEYASRY